MGFAFPETLVCSVERTFLVGRVPLLHVDWQEASGPHMLTLAESTQGRLLCPRAPHPTLPECCLVPLCMRAGLCPCSISRQGWEKEAPGAGPGCS